MQHGIQVFAHAQSMFPIDANLHGRRLGAGVDVAEWSRQVAEAAQPITDQLAVVFRVAATELHERRLEGGSIGPHRGKPLHATEIQHRPSDRVRVARVEHVVDVIQPLAVQADSVVVVETFAGHHVPDRIDRPYMLAPQAPQLVVEVRTLGLAPTQDQPRLPLSPLELDLAATETVAQCGSCELYGHQWSFQ